MTRALLEQARDALRWTLDEIEETTQPHDWTSGDQAKSHRKARDVISALDAALAAPPAGTYTRGELDELAALPDAALASAFRAVAACNYDKCYASLFRAHVIEKARTLNVYAAPVEQPVAWCRTYNGTRMGVSLDRMGGSLLDGWEEQPLYAAPAAPADARTEAEKVCGEAYQVVGSLLSDMGIFDNEQSQKALDNLSQARMVHQDVLPWPSFAPALKDDDVFTLIGHAEFLRSVRGEQDMPAYFLGLAERIANALGDKAMRERVTELAAAMKGTP